MKIHLYIYMYMYIYLQYQNSFYLVPWRINKGGYNFSNLFNIYLYSLATIIFYIFTHNAVVKSVWTFCCNLWYFVQVYRIFLGCMQIKHGKRKRNIPWNKLYWRKCLSIQLSNANAFLIRKKKTITCNIYEIDVLLIFHYIDFDCVS